MTPLDIFLGLIHYLLGIFHIYPPKVGAPKAKDKDEKEKVPKVTSPLTIAPSPHIVSEQQFLVECPESKRSGHDKAVCHICSPKTTTQPSVFRPLSISITQGSDSQTTGSTSGKNVITPSESEVRNYWIERLKRSELESALKRFNLSTEGNVGELKLRLTSYFDEFLDSESSQNTPNPVEKDDDSHLLEYAGLPPLFPLISDSDTRHGPVKTTNVHTKPRVSLNEARHTTYSRPNDEITLVKEILGFAPNVSTDFVLRSIVEMKDGYRRSETFNAPKSFEHNDFTLPYNTTRTSLAPPTDGGADDLSQLCNTMRRWNLRYEGGKDTVA